MRICGGGGDGSVTFTWYVPVVLSASGEISRIEPVTAISARPSSQTLTGRPTFACAICSLATAKRWIAEADGVIKSHVTIEEVAS